jgi:[NiFe] hydrogenase diaphorase moiety large subunit
MLGSQALMADLCTRLGVEAHQTRDDGLGSVTTCSCTGLCDQGPALLVNHHHVVTRLDGERIAQLAERVLQQVPVAQWPAHWFEVHDNIRRADVLLGLPLARGTAIQAAIGRGAQGTLDEITTSRLRGRGGTGLSTGRK